MTTTNTLSRWTRTGADEGGCATGTGRDKDGRGGDVCGARGRVRQTGTDAARRRAGGTTGGWPRRAAAITAATLAAPEIAVAASRRQRRPNSMAMLT